jgi:predicted nuclease with TOPRIM domain
MQEKARKSKLKVLRIKEKNLREIVEARVSFIDSVAPKYEALQKVTYEYKALITDLQKGKIKLDDDIKEKISNLSDKYEGLTHEVDRYKERIARLDDHLGFIYEEIRDLDVQKFSEIKKEIQQYNQNRNNQEIENVR